MASSQNGMEELENDLEKMCLDSSNSQISNLTMELEKLDVDGSRPVPVEPVKEAPVEAKILPSQQIQKRVYQQLVDMLNTPGTPEQRQRVSEVLQNFPTMLAEFIKRRNLFVPSQVAFVKRAQEQASRGPCKSHVTVTSSRQHHQKLPAVPPRQIHGRSFLARIMEVPRKQISHTPRNQQELIHALLILREKRRQAMNQRGATNGSSAQKQQALLHFRPIKACKPNPMKPVYLKKIVSMYGPEVIMLKPCSPTDVAAMNMHSRKPMLIHRLQLARPLPAMKLRHPTTTKPNYKELAAIARARPITSSTIFTMPRPTVVTEVEESSSMVTVPEQKLPQL